MGADDLTERERVLHDALQRLRDAEDLLRTDEDARHFLIEASEVLGASLDYETTLANITRLAVPRMGDWCSVYVRDDDGAIRTIAVAHADPDKVALAHELGARYPPDPDAPHGVGQVLRTGEPEVFPEISDALLEQVSPDPELLAILRALGLRSSMLVPFLIDGHAIGAISLVAAESGRRYTARDLELAREVARRAATAIAHAKLYRQVKSLNEELERRVEERTAQLTEMNRELESFSYTISHDLRAPVRHIAGFVDLLQRSSGDRLDDRGQRYLRTIADSAKQMGALIDALLAFSRMGRAELRQARVDLARVVDAVRADLEPEVSGRVIDWEVGALPAVRGDPVMLRQVLYNLLGNAVKYTRGRERAHIQVEAREAEAPGEVEVVVRDDGVGFNMDYAHKLFGVFQRLHSASEYEGTGIGLASVKRIVQRHGGRVWAEGQPRHGAAFHLTLPRYDELEEGTPTP